GRRAARFGTSLAEVERSLAGARGTGRGWERGRLEAAARGAGEGERPGVEIRELTRVQVIDRPGTEEDKAVFRVVAAEVQARITLGRVDGEWVGEGVEPG